MIDQSILFYSDLAPGIPGDYTITLATCSNGNTAESLPLDEMISILKKYNQIRQ